MSNLLSLIFNLKIIFILLICLFVSKKATAGPESPEFIRTKNWKVENVTTETIILTAEVVFYNPNKLKAKLRELDLDIFMNEKKVGKLVQEDMIKIKGKSSFDIPIRISIDIAETGIDLSNVLGLLTNKKFLLDLTGYLKARVFIFPFKVKIDERQEFSLKDFF